MADKPEQKPDTAADVRKDVPGPLTSRDINMADQSAEVGEADESAPGEQKPAAGRPQNK